MYVAESEIVFVEKTPRGRGNGSSASVLAHVIFLDRNGGPVGYGRLGRYHDPAGFPRHSAATSAILM